MSKNTPDKPDVFQYDFKNEDGSMDVWKYNMRINPYGPIEVTHVPAKKEPIVKRKKNKYQRD